MGSVEEIQQVCRLCLVKDQVNIPIFDETSDIRQTFLKISACLPVKLSRDDNLPKKICDGCSYKLDMLYVFRNTSVESEKQLIQWLNQVGLSTPQLAKPEILVKQETFDPPNESGDISDTQNYLLQQQKLPYPQEFAFGEVSEEAAGTADLLPEEEGPSPKRARRAASLKKPPPQPVETDDEDLDAAMQITKAEDEDSEDADQPEYVEAPSTSADDQPGPSGVGKGAVEAPAPFDDQLYRSTFDQIPNLEPSSLDLHCKYLMSIVDQDPKEPEIPDNILNESDADLLNLLTNEADCSDLLNNIASNEQFEHLITTSERNFVDELIDGLKKEEPKKPEATFKCYHCDKEFKTKKLLKKHLFIHTGIRRFSCEICDKSFKYRYEVEEHKKSHNNPTYQCEICSKMFVHKTHLTTHRKKHLNKFVASCEECDLGFISQAAYKNHVNINHKNQQLVCDVCGSRLSSLSSLKEHKLTHDPSYGKERTHICEICGKSYLSSRNLRGHMKIHQRLRLHVCDICGKSVSSKKILETHIKMHTGLKDFICGVCSKAFASKEYLDVHMRIHTGNKPFGCEMCGKRFTQKTSLTVHLRHHTGQRPYKCECGKEFTTKSHLMTHYKTHDVGGVDIDYITNLNCT